MNEAQRKAQLRAEMDDECERERADMSYQNTIDRLIRMDYEQLKELFYDVLDDSNSEHLRIINQAIYDVLGEALVELSYCEPKDKKELSQDEDALEVDNARRARELKE